MNNQLEADLVQKLDNRLQQACKDHITLCGIAEISGQSCASIMFATIAAFLTEGIAITTDMTPEAFGKAMADGVRMHRARRATA